MRVDAKDLKCCELLFTIRLFSYLLFSVAGWCIAVVIVVIMSMLCLAVLSCTFSCAIQQCYVCRLQTGMRGAFGKPQGTVARVHIGQPIMSVRSRENTKDSVIEALRRAKFKYPGRQKVRCWCGGRRDVTFCVT